MTEVSSIAGHAAAQAYPLETALRPESGPYRVLIPEDPEMANVGNAREAINMHQVYRRGELVWRGPGPHR